ncbi:MAG: hypothetical protein BJBARM5_0262 [Candidatus Parvarchaeum acidophilus ARMAN-5]|jgi:hypothetical protein|uniref:NUDIX hydrolase n=1 Tax=Candidatus Parvarchaeum acidophilus ARMAN-5 TaxID=662762 RepID=D6GUW4_PARA5|nr:MAG: hypothetical protein BJBARM5_0262 [Candidatus Parvarchaeum acidophilus ARMAN-5]
MFMPKRVSALIIRDDKVLMVKLKTQDRYMPRATWVFPFIELSEDNSPRREILLLIKNFSIDVRLTGKFFNYYPSENPKLQYFLYVMDYLKGEPEVMSNFQAYKWVQISDITSYSTSFMDNNVSKFLDEKAKEYNKN